MKILNNLIKNKIANPLDIMPISVKDNYYIENLEAKLLILPYRRHYFIIIDTSKRQIAVSTEGENEILRNICLTINWVNCKIQKKNSPQ